MIDEKGGKDRVLSNMNYFVKVWFRGEFLLDRGVDSIVPTERLFNDMQNIFPNGKAENTTLKNGIITFTIETDDNPESLKNAFINWAHDVYKGIENVDDGLKVDIQKNYSATQSDTSEGKEEKENTTEGTQAAEIFSGIKGWNSFVSEAENLAKMAPIIKQNKTFKSFSMISWLISVDRGCGLTSAMSCFSDFLKTYGLFNFGMQPVKEYRLGSKDENGDITPHSLIEELKCVENRKRICVIDMSGYMSNDKKTHIRELLLSLTHIQDDYIFVFRIPFMEPKVIKETAAMLSDVLYVRPVTIPPLSIEALQQIAEDRLKSQGFTMQDDAWTVFCNKIAEEKSDGRFYGGITVEKLVSEVIYRKQLGGKADDNRKTISAEDIKGLSDYNPSGSEALKELEEMVGMEEITRKIKEIIAQIRLTKNNPKIKKPCYHMRFVGNPGTGKTTVARILGKVMNEEGLLRNGFFFEHAARDLCGEYLGQTAPKTLAICRDAYGSVLFIDEAYALYAGDRASDDYGREALTTLISEMENHRDDMVVIMAGYTDDMEELMKGNAGLRSRMPFLLEFKNYNQDQLFRIFMGMVNKGFKTEDGFEEAAKEYFLGLSDDYVKMKEFANGRFVRNLYERTWSKAAVRASMTGETDVSLTIADFDAAKLESEFKEKLGKNKIGF